MGEGAAGRPDAESGSGAGPCGQGARAAHFSLIVPAYNEESQLPRSLPSLVAAMEACGRRGELIVVDNNSTDRTAEIARGHGARVVFEPHNQISRSRNAGARAATGRHLVFVDADTLISPRLLAAALENLESGVCCGGGATVELDRYHFPGVRRFVRFWNWFSRRSRTAAGSFIYCRREAFEQVGGFSERVYAAEELFLSRALRRWGRRRGMEFRIISQHPVLSSARKGDWFTPRQMLWPTLMMLLLPFLLTSRRCCSLWYKRPPAGD
jgi:glycosyltransferase involved in cell wall biosynthesis